MLSVLQRAIDAAGGWLGFDAFMALALYTPGLGYYASGSRKFGHMPQSGSDFVTAPELSPHFGRALARQVGQAMQATGVDEVWEFGAGSGALAGTCRAVCASASKRDWPLTVSACAGCKRCPRLSAVWWWAMKCWTPCRCNCWRVWTEPGKSAVWSGTRAAWLGLTGQARCARHWTWMARTTT
jgi:hypothetical protein